MMKSIFIKVFCFLSIMEVSPTHASINSKPVISTNSQLVSLNLELKSNNKKVSSNITMPFYQTAELEKLVGTKNVLIELNPKRGKNADEISLELKLFRQSGARAYFKKEFIAKINQDSNISLKGLSLKLRPVLN